jgi:hypothetical protein
MGTSRSLRLLSVFCLVAVITASGCQRPSTTDNSEDVKLDLTLQPDPPTVGQATATVQLEGKDGKPVEGATVKLEFNMNLAGMTPVFADAKEMKPGQHEATLELTMGGDWFVLVNATLADGRKLSRKVDVRGVKSR